MFIVRSENFADRWPSCPRLVEPTSSLVLHSLDEPGTRVRFDAFTARRATRSTTGEVYQLRLGVMGSSAATAGYAVAAEWQLTSPAHVAAFEESRRQLFELRRRHLASFVFDWLLQRLDHAGEYLVLGLYGDEEGLRLDDEHPEIHRFTRDHPPASYAATAPFGARFFRVESPLPR